MSTLKQGIWALLFQHLVNHFVKTALLYFWTAGKWRNVWGVSCKTVSWDGFFFFPWTLSKLISGMNWILSAEKSIRYPFYPCYLPHTSHITLASEWITNGFLSTINLYYINKILGRMKAIFILFWIFIPDSSRYWINIYNNPSDAESMLN